MLGVTDAHNHVWIDPIPGADSAAPVLNQYGKIRDELLSYRSAGGESLMDCQPGGCGRNANKLAQLSRESSVNIVACTGFHRKKYYSPDHIFFSLSINETAKFLIRELTSAMDETRNQPKPIRAGFIKLALESMWNDTPQAALEGAAVAAHETGALVEIHTEKGALAGKVVVYFEDHGVDPKQLVLCHMDKRPDPGLHMELARYGALLEYDTFYRAKYEPETRLWPLIQSMVEAGLSNHIALATDMAEAEMYKNIGGGPGMASLPTEIRLKLAKIGVLDNSIRQMLGGNIARRLAGLD
jgi:phosphotriesterase-related protein